MSAFQEKFKGIGIVRGFTGKGDIITLAPPSPKKLITSRDDPRLREPVKEEERPLFALEIARKVRRPRGE